MNVSELETKCHSKGYHTSKPIDARDSNLAFVAYKDNYGIIFLHRKIIGIGPGELYYRKSYPDIKYKTKIIGGTR
jgi:hypothetical protein